MNKTSQAAPSATQLDAYNREGCLILPEPIFAPSKFDALKSHFERKLAALPPDVRPESMDVPHFTDPKLFEWLLADEILDLVRPMLGSDIAFFEPLHLQAEGERQAGPLARGQLLLERDARPDAGRHRVARDRSEHA